MLRIGLALSGGGLRGAAHVGVLKCLTDHGIRPDVISGTSAGSVVAGLYASGLSASDLGRVAKSLSASRLFDVHPPLALAASLAKTLNEALGGPTALLKWAPNGIIRGRRLEAFLSSVGLERSFERMRLPCIVTSTQVDNAREILFSDEKTAAILRRRCKLRRKRTTAIAGVPPVAAIRASCSIPGLFQPKSINGMQLVDGGVKDNLPLEPLDLLYCDVIIGVDLGYAGERREGIDNIAEIVSQSLDIMAAQSVNLAVDMLKSKYRGRLIRVQPRIYDVGLFDASRIPECISRGYTAMKKSIPLVVRLVNGKSA